MLPLTTDPSTQFNSDDVPTVPMLRAARACRDSERRLRRPTDDTFSSAAARFGALGRGMFIELLAKVFDRGLTGTVSLTTPAGDTHEIYFERGVPVKAELVTPCFRLGEELLRWGFLDYEEVEQASYEATKRGLHLGTYLVECCAVPVAAIEGALRSQVIERVGLLANLPDDTMYAIYGNSDLLPAAGGGRGWAAEPLDGILATVRSMHDRPSVRATALRASQQRLILRDPECCTFATSTEAAILSTIASEEPSFDELLGAYGAMAEDVYTVVAALVLGRNLVSVPVASRSGTIPRVDI